MTSMVQTEQADLVRGPSQGVAQRVAGLVHRAKGSTWAQPAMKLLLVSALVSGLAWVGTRGLFGVGHGPAIPGQAPGVLTANIMAASPPPPLTSAAASAVVDPSASAPPATAAPALSGILSDGRVVLNAANEQELRKLPKVGPSRAQAIVALRTKMGRFRSVRDLLRVKGIGPRTLQKMMPLMVLDPPAAPTTPPQS